MEDVLCFYFLYMDDIKTCSSHELGLAKVISTTAYTICVLACEHNVNERRLSSQDYQMNSQALVKVCKLSLCSVEMWN